MKKAFYKRLIYFCIILFLVPLHMSAQNNLIPDPGTCSSFKAPFKYTIKNEWNSSTSNGLDTRYTPMVGDIDGDGKTEVFAARTGYIEVFEGLNGSSIATIPCAGLKSDWTNGMLICNIKRNNEGRGQVFIAAGGGIYLYEVSSAPGVRPMTFSTVWEKTLATGTCMPIASDLDGDGQVEFITGKHIIDANTGEVLTTLAYNGYDGDFSNFPLAVDLDNDGLPEVVVGTNVYKFNRSNNPMATVWKQSPAVAGEGVSMAADVNQDGIVDLVYRDNKNTSTVTVWTPSTGATIGTFTFNAGSSFRASYVFIGDIDGIDNGNGKKYPEICINTAGILHAYAYNGSSFSEKWTLTHTDRSGATALTLFDFDYDGIVELIYRDENSLRIFDGRGSKPVVTDSIPCGSATIVETPIVADVTGNGSANIIVTGHPGGSMTSINGEVMVFGGKDSPWASAPNVWNQQFYSPLHVNLDLTIPTRVQSPALSFIDCNNKKIQLYNGGPMQAPVISDANYCPIEPAFDFFVISGDVVSTSSQVTFTVKVGNQGMTKVPAGAPIQFYATSTNNNIGSTTLQADLEPGESVTITKTCPITGSPAQFYVRLLDDGTNFPALGTYRDCDLTNNTKSFGALELIVTTDELTGCVNGINSFKIELKNSSVVDYQNIVLIDSIAPGLGFISATEGITYNAQANYYTATVASLQAGSSKIYYIVTKAESSGTLRNTAWISSINGSSLDREDKSAYVVVGISEAPATPTITPSGRVAICPPSTNVTLTINQTANAYQWYKNGVIIPGATSKTYLASETGSYAATVSNTTCTSDMSDAVVVSIGSSVDMYWKKNATNSNWNDPANWVNESGVALNSVPTQCSNVHIPGNASAYPSLDATNTPRATYGDPACKDITFHYGAEVAQPHLLTYEKAYIQYNFGYYDTSNSYKTDGDKYSATPMKRGQWYALAAPLKSIVSGDFSFGGYPNTWQQGFKRSDMTVNGFTGEWYNPDSTNALNISQYQNAISLWIGEYLPAELGESAEYHTNLNTLKGVIEVPYFENKTVSDLHRIHTYNGTTSTFSYYHFDVPQFPLADPVQYPPGSITRGSEAYRFIFDGELVDAAVNGAITKVYKVSVPAGKEIMIGNPFLSTLNFRKFYDINSGKIDAYYRLYVNNGWQEYSYAAGAQILSEYIAPLQAFFISTLGSSGTTDLYFPPEFISETRPAGSDMQLRSTGNTSKESDVLIVTTKSEEGENSIQIAFDKLGEKNVSKLFMKDYLEIPQVYAIDNTYSKNAVQFMSSYDVIVPLGVWCTSEETIELSFNLDNINVESLTLIDTYLNKGINVKKNNVYKFKGTGSEDAQNRFQLQVGPLKAPTAIDQLGESNIDIYTQGRTLYIKSDEILSEIKITTVQGSNIISNSALNSKEYTKELSIPTGIYIVTAKSQNGEIKTNKIIIK